MTAGEQARDQYDCHRRLGDDESDCLSGDNDIGWTHCNPERNHYARYLEDQIVEPMYRYCLKGNEKICYGLNEEMSDAERWYRNHRIVHAVASEFGIAHMCFLQPCSVADAYRMSDFEMHGGKGFPNCAATVEDGSHCESNDACFIQAVQYRGIKSTVDCNKAWE